MLRVASALALLTGLIVFFTPKKSIGPPCGAIAYASVPQGVEHDWL